MADGPWSLLFSVLLGATPIAPPSAPLSAEDCVRVALQGSPRMDEAYAHVHQFEARLQEVQSVYYPKIISQFFVAPMFRVMGDGYSRNWSFRWKSIRDWGPHTNLEMVVAQPFYTFGRVEAGEEAMQARIDVERARVRDTRHVLALEVRRLYYTRLFAQSMLTPLKQALDAVQSAQTHAAALYERGTGEVTQVDMARLEYGAAEAGRYYVMAQSGVQVATAALLHTMGLDADTPLELADKILPALPEDEPVLQLTTLLQDAALSRPEWDQLNQGRKAALALERAERRARFPVAFVAGQLHWAYSPLRDRDPNPWHYDDQNTFTGGVAIGLKFDVDWAQTVAKVAEARAQAEEVEALGRFAATGIPLQVRKAYEDVQQARHVVILAKGGVQSTRKWLTAADQGYQSGTGEARDLLEGLVAYVQAKRTYFENLQAFHIARAELTYAVGAEGP